MCDTWIQRQLCEKYGPPVTEDLQLAVRWNDPDSKGGEGGREECKQSEDVAASDTGEEEEDEEGGDDNGHICVTVCGNGMRPPPDLGTGTVVTRNGTTTGNPACCATISSRISAFPATLTSFLAPYVSYLMASRTTRTIEKKGNAYRVDGVSSTVADPQVALHVAAAIWLDPSLRREGRAEIWVHSASSGGPESALRFVDGWIQRLCLDAISASK